MLNIYFLLLLLLKIMAKQAKIIENYNTKRVNSVFFYVSDSKNSVLYIDDVLKEFIRIFKIKFFINIKNLNKNYLSDGFIDFESTEKGTLIVKQLLTFYKQIVLNDIVFNFQYSRRFMKTSHLPIYYDYHCSNDSQIDEVNQYQYQLPYQTPYQLPYQLPYQIPYQMPYQIPYQIQHLPSYQNPPMHLCYYIQR